MNKILQSIFKIWNFLPLFQMLFLWLNKTPLNEILLLVYKRVLILILKLYHKWDTNLKILFEKLKFLEIGGGAVLLLWALFSPPLAWIAKNGVIRALKRNLSPLVINKWVKIIPKTKSFCFGLSPKDGERRGATTKDELRSGRLCLCRRLQFPFNIPMTRFEIHLKTH
jgi:hypothetical protein